MAVIDYPIEGFQEKINATQTGYPVSNGGFWHNGIHFSGNTAITNIYDGEIVALRLTDEYESSFSYPNDQITLLLVTALFGIGGYLYYKYAVNRPQMDRYFDLENNYYKLKPGLTDDEKQDAMNLVGELFSSNFLLTKHIACTLQGKFITFYSLVMHLKPLKRLSNAQKMSLYWYEGQFTVKTPKYNAVAIRSCKKMVGDNEQNVWLSTIPCETVVTTIEKGEHTSKIEWVLNETRYRATIDTKLIRFDCTWGGKHDEIRRPPNENDKKREGWEEVYLKTGFSQQNGVLVYSTASIGTRVVKAVLDSRYGFDIRKTDVLEAYTAEATVCGTVIEVEYRNSTESKHDVKGYIYIEKLMSDIEKEDFLKFKTVVTGSVETRKTFGGIEISIRLKAGIAKNRVFTPDEAKVKKGEVIGFAGYTLTTDRDGEQVVENEDATAIHYETFTVSDTFLTESKDQNEPCEYKIAESVTAKTGQLRTVQTQKTVSIDGTVLENLSNVYIRRMGSGSLIQGEVFYKVKVLATVADSLAGEYVDRDTAFTGWDKPRSTWKGKASASVSLYNSQGSALPDKTVNIYTDLYYLWKEQKDVTVDEKVVPLRIPAWWYIKITGEHIVYISEENFKKLRYINADDYILSGTVIPAAQLLEEPTQTAWSGEPVQLATEICDHEKKVITEYQSFSRKTIKNEWQKLKRRSDGAIVWIKASDIKNMRDGKPVERIRYNDWNYFFKKIDLKQAGTYKFSRLTASEFEKAGLPTYLGEPLEREVNRSVSQTITGAPKPFGDILSSYGPAREYWSQCYYKNATEWKKDDDLTRALYANCRSYRTRTEKLRDGLEFWDDAKRLRSPNFPASEENWYFHPKQFIDHLNKVVTQAEFNPYEEKNFSMRTTDDTYGNGEWKSVTVVNSPGFAPIATYKTDYEHNGQYYGPISGLFNQDYSKLAYYASQGIKMVHEGLDFPAAEGTVIHSFIHGQVLAYGWLNSGYGYIMIVKETGKNKLYFLAHLKPNSEKVSKEGELISPGQPVACVGRTGRDKNPTAWPAHLHLEVWESSVDGKNKIFKEKLLDGEYLQFVEKFSAKERSGMRRDPFKHDDIYTP